jgi:hypothetical protein
MEQNMSKASEADKLTNRWTNRQTFSGKDTPSIHDVLSFVVAVIIIIIIIL